MSHLCTVVQKAVRMTQAYVYRDIEKNGVPGSATEESRLASGVASAITLAPVVPQKIFSSTGLLCSSPAVWFVSLCSLILFYFLFWFLLYRTRQTAVPILTLHGSEDVKIELCKIVIKQISGKILKLEYSYYNHCRYIKSEKTMTKMTFGEIPQPQVFGRVLSESGDRFETGQVLCAFLRMRREKKNTKLP